MKIGYQRRRSNTRLLNRQMRIDCSGDHIDILEEIADEIGRGSSKAAIVRWLIEELDVDTELRNRMFRAMTN